MMTAWKQFCKMAGKKVAFLMSHLSILDCELIASNFGEKTKKWYL